MHTALMVLVGAYKQTYMYCTPTISITEKCCCHFASFQLCSTSYTTLQLKTNARSASAINPVTTEIVAKTHAPTINYWKANSYSTSFSDMFSTRCTYKLFISRTLQGYNADVQLHVYNFN